MMNCPRSSSARGFLSKFELLKAAVSIAIGGVELYFG
jgi:hypothetical protein